MKIPRIAESVNHIDNDLILEAARERKTAKATPFLKWSALAACFCILIMAAAIVIPLFKPEAGMDNPLYKDVHIQEPEFAIVWPWEYKTIYEQYTSLSYQGKTYSGRAKEIRAELLGEALGSVQAKGYDIYTEKEYTENFEIYSINGISEQYLIAAEMDGKFYVFDAHEPNAFATLGEMMNAFAMEQNIQLDRFSVQDKNQKTKYYSLTDGGTVWEILDACKNAKAVNDTEWRPQTSYISFTVTSEALGVYRNVMYITEDGYLWTNAFNYANIFEIGEDAAKRIIDHVKNHSEQTESESYQITIAGKITEVGENYFILDTTPVCVNEKDGKIYKIMAEDIRIQRVLSFEKISIGDIAVVTYDGKIKDGNLIESASDLQKGFLSSEDGNILIPE
ncbi:MAG: hypothetical protein IJA86_04670 [Clostridia bacterium]|nr:hypothetical protein [Clostridia bacterium]